MSAAATQFAEAPTTQTIGQPVSGEEAKWKQVEGLPCHVSIEVPVPGFRLQDLLALRSTSVVSSDRAITANLPFRVNGELIAWCEFEVLANRLSVRLTELA